LHACKPDPRQLPQATTPLPTTHHYLLLATSICGELNSWIAIVIPLLRCKAIANRNQASCCDIIEFHENRASCTGSPKALLGRALDWFVVDIGMNISCNLRLHR